MRPEVLRRLAESLRRQPDGAPVTWGVLAELLDEAAADAEQAAYEEYMGEDL